MADRFLLFTLAAPLASFGIGAGNESRGTSEAPGHSLVVGLIGSALGLDRQDPRLLEMSDAMACAVAVEHRGPRLSDFHTVQSRRAVRGPEPRTRRAALASAEPYTTISQRDYFADVKALVAVAVHGGPFPLEQMAAVLKSPLFTLYFGRKCCPLALPPDPEILDAATAEAAISVYRDRAAERGDLFRVRGAAGPVVQRMGMAHHANAVRRQRRRTGPEDRSTWSYRLLDELVLAPPATTSSEATT